MLRCSGAGRQIASPYGTRLTEARRFGPCQASRWNASSSMPTSTATASQLGSLMGPFRRTRRTQQRSFTQAAPHVAGGAARGPRRAREGLIARICRVLRLVQLDFRAAGQLDGGNEAVTAIDHVAG